MDDQKVNDQMTAKKLGTMVLVSRLKENDRVLMNFDFHASQGRVAVAIRGAAEAVIAEEMNLEIRSFMEGTDECSDEETLRRLDLEIAVLTDRLLARGAQASSTSQAVNLVLAAQFDARREFREVLVEMARTMRSFIADH